MYMFAQYKYTVFMCVNVYTVTLRNGTFYASINRKNIYNVIFGHHLHTSTTHKPALAVNNKQCKFPINQKVFVI